MDDFVTLTCPSCGGKLEISDNIERFVCSSCKNEHVVRRGGGIISISPVEKELGKINHGVNNTAAELALVRINKDIRNIGNLKLVLKKVRIPQGPHNYGTFHLELSGPFSIKGLPPKFWCNFVWINL